MKQRLVTDGKPGRRIARRLFRDQRGAPTNDSIIYDVDFNITSFELYRLELPTGRPIGDCTCRYEALDVLTVCLKTGQGSTWADFGETVSKGYFTRPAPLSCIEVFEEIGLPLLALALIIGAVAGVSGFLYSLAVPVLGLGLATALNSGSSIATSLLPLARVHGDTMLRKSGLLTIAGVVTIAGICVCAKAGSLRKREDKARDDAKTPGRTKLTFFKGVVFCIVTGIIASGINLGLAFPNRMLDVARKFGSSGFGATNAVVAPYLVGGFFSNFFHAVCRVHKNHNFSKFFASGALGSAGWSIFMVLLFVVRISAHAGGVAVLGSFGAIVAWGIFSAARILTSSL